MRPVFLVGFPGTGKTTIGRMAAARCGLQFLDTDFLLEEEYGISEAELIKRNGEEFFRKAEQKILQDVILMEDVLVATGGGLPCYSDNMDIILDNCSVCIYLKNAPEILANRIINSYKDRPLQHHEDIYQYVADLLSEREKFYSSSQETIETVTRQSADDVVEIISHLTENY